MPVQRSSKVSLHHALRNPAMAAKCASCSEEAIKDTPVYRAAIWDRIPSCLYLSAHMCVLERVISTRNWKWANFRWPSI